MHEDVPRAVGVPGYQVSGGGLEGHIAAIGADGRSKGSKAG